MINIITVHWKDDQWIDIQLKYIKRHIKGPFRVWAFLNYIEADHSHKFYYSSTENINSHAIKLNILADLVVHHAKDENEIMIFLDGDAFPIADLDDFIEENLKQNPLIAVKREENLMDPQPHPLFCITTCGFWKKIKGDWKKGHEWINSEGIKVTDVGGNLLGLLEQSNIKWMPILRSNPLNEHPLFYAIYGDLVYHHGAAFRTKFTRVDESKINNKISTIEKLFGNSILYKILSKPRELYLKNKIVKRNKEESDFQFQKILEDDNFYINFK